MTSRNAVLWCSAHRQHYLEQSGCKSCAAHERALEIAEPLSLVDMAERESALVARAIDRAKAAIASIDRALSDDEQRRKKTHEAAALELVSEQLFAALCGPQSQPVNSAFELECVK